MSERNLINAFTKWRSRFMRQALRMLPSEEDAEDVLQDAFIRLWPMAEQIQTDQDASALASVTVRNLSIDRYRSHQRMENIVVEKHQLEEQAETDEEEQERRLQQVEAIMEQVLTPLQRQIIQLREYEQRSYEEVAQMLGMQQAAVRMQLSRARKAIRDAYRLNK